MKTNLNTTALNITYTNLLRNKVAGELMSNLEASFTFDAY